MTLTEQVFRKMGFVELDNGSWLRKYSYEGVNYGGEIFKELPPIDSQWEVTAKYLVPFMIKRKSQYAITPHEGTYHFEWVHSELDTTYGHAEIKDDNIAKAACKAFMEVSLD